MPREDTQTHAPHTEAQDVSFQPDATNEWPTTPDDVDAALDELVTHRKASFFPLGDAGTGTAFS